MAALALHQWSLYQSNNKVYTQLFREISADNTLDIYVHTMQQSENSKTVAVVLLILLLLQLPLAYYLLYYRHVLSYRFAMIEQTKAKRTDEAEQESLKLELMTDELHRLNMRMISFISPIPCSTTVCLRSSTKRCIIRRASASLSIRSPMM